MERLTLRVARPVSDLTRSQRMYCQGLELKEIASFENHAGFSGVMLGKAESPWHLEFTLCHTHPVLPQPSAEDLLVLYLPDETSWAKRCRVMAEVGFERITSFNPYWEQAGQTFIDHDGYRTVIQRQTWPVK